MLALSGCTSTPLPGVDDVLLAAAVGVDEGKLVRGYRLAVTTCASCHTAVHPWALSASEWDDVLPAMLRKSNLPAGDGDTIRAYITAVRRLREQPG